jgi:hypothetical protein
MFAHPHQSAGVSHLLNSYLTNKDIHTSILVIKLQAIVITLIQLDIVALYRPNDYTIPPVT